MASSFGRRLECDDEDFLRLFAVSEEQIAHSVDPKRHAADIARRENRQCAVRDEPSNHRS